MPRGNYRSVANVDRERLVNAFVEGRDYQVVAKDLGIARQTARNIIVNFCKDGRVERRPTGGRRNQKIDDEMIQYLIAKIESKPTSTLNELKQQMRVDLPNKPHVSHQAISKKLDGLLYTVKDVRSVPEQWNTPRVKEERQQFANWFMGDGLRQHKVFVDEFGVNVWTARSKGRAPIGARAVRIVEGQRGSNVTICLAISPQFGLVHSSISPQAMTQERFGEFLLELAELMRFTDDNYVVLCDNARPHHNSPNFGTIRYLPTYSPFINACEAAGSCLKAAVKRRLSEPLVQREIYDRHIPRNETLHNRRIRIVCREVESCLPVLTVAKCIQFVDHVMTYMPACIRRDDIFD